MKTLLNLLLKTKPYQRRHPPKPTSGFTMIELLVGMVIAFLIITPMLAFVVNILDNDVKEQAKTNTEQDLQAAMDYIAQDMSQAVYVYDETGVDAIEDDLPHSTDASRKPILAFWKREFVEDALLASDLVCDSDTSSCNDTFVNSLVVYYLIEESSNIWCGSAGGSCKRIARYQIKDGVKSGSGYVCGSNGRDTAVCDNTYKQKFMRDNGYQFYVNDVSTTDIPPDWTPETGETLPTALTTLVSHIEGFNLDDPLVDGSVRLIEASGYKLAKIQIVGNALRRSQSDFSCEVTPATVTTPATYKNDPYCPKATARVGARSGYGE